VHPAVPQLGDDPHPVRIRHRREHGKQLVTGQRHSLIAFLSPVRKNLHVEGGQVNPVRTAA
jgi:hypothetical protein